MVRFIFACMVVVALSLLAMPLTGIYSGIEDRRDVTVAQTDALPADESEEDIFAAAADAAEPSADALNAISTAAGGFEGPADNSGFSGSFSGQAPTALAGDEPAATPVDAAVPAPDAQ